MAKFYNKSSYLRDKEIWFGFLCFFILFLVVIISRVLGNNLPQGNLQSLSVWFLLVVLIIFIAYPLGKFFIHKSDLYSHGIWGEQAIGKELRKLPDDFTVFHGLRVPGVGDIDYVVIGPNGLFAVEVKSHRARGILNQLLPRFISQTKYESQQLRRYIEKQTGESHWVEGVLALSRAHVSGGYRIAEGVHVVEKDSLVRLLQNFEPKGWNYYNSGQKIIQLFV